MKQSKCYANQYDDCSDKMSGEHCLSLGILDVISPDGQVIVGGSPWLKGERRPIPSLALVANVLCTAHNKALSPLDKEAIRLFTAMTETEEILLSPNKRPQHASYRFNGDVIERWMMKVLCGYAASGNFQSGVKLAPPKGWVDVVFGKAVFPPHRGGLFYSWGEGTVRQDQGRHAGVYCVTSDLGVCGARVELNAHSFTVTTAHPEDSFREARDSFMPVKGHRPAQVICTDGVSERVLNFGWSVPGENKAVVVKFDVRV
jgi:hypothetical protein